MESSKIEAIYYNDPCDGDGYVYCVLDPSINGEEFVNNLNDKIEPFNKGMEEYHEKSTELRSLHKYYATFDEIVGTPRLNEREPKYPAQKPQGFKSIQEACPEITIERERRKKVNEQNDIIYRKYKNDAEEKINEALKPFKDELLEKWPEFKSWINSYSPSKIYYNFSLVKFKYISNK